MGIIASLIVLLLVLFWIDRAGKKVRKINAASEMFDAHKNAWDVIESGSISKTTETIDRMRDSYQANRQFLHEYEKNMYHEDMKELTDYLSSIEQDEWEKKALPHLEKFADSYEIIMSGDFETFKDVDRLFKERARCLRQWQAYFGVDLSEYRTTIYPKRYLREYMGTEYESCMEGYMALEKRLDDRIQHMRPEQQRKNRLYKIIVDKVAQCESIQRSDLFNTPFDGYTRKEVECVERDLVKKNRLAEVKLGSRWLSCSPTKKPSSANPRRILKPQKRPVPSREGNRPSCKMLRPHPPLVARKCERWSKNITRSGGFCAATFPRARDDGSRGICALGGHG